MYLVHETKENTILWIIAKIYKNLKIDLDRFDRLIPSCAAGIRNISNKASLIVSGRETTPWLSAVGAVQEGEGVGLMTLESLKSIAPVGTRCLTFLTSQP